MKISDFLNEARDGKWGTPGIKQKTVKLEDGSKLLIKLYKVNKYGSEVSIGLAAYHTTLDKDGPSEEIEDLMLDQSQQTHVMDSIAKKMTGKPVQGLEKLFRKEAEITLKSKGTK